MEISRRDFMHIAAIFGLGAATAGCSSKSVITPTQISLKDIYEYRSKIFMILKLPAIFLCFICVIYMHILSLCIGESRLL